LIVVDASAVLAYLRREPGWEVVREAIGDSLMPAANWSEVLQKAVQHGLDATRVGRLLLSRGIAVEPVTIVDAEAAAYLWGQRRNLSLGDRLCLALADRLGCEALTADVAWDGMPNARLIR
jgi:ribonuclease VapC